MLFARLDHELFGAQICGKVPLDVQDDRSGPQYGVDLRRTQVCTGVQVRQFLPVGRNSLFGRSLIADVGVCQPLVQRCLAIQGRNHHDGVFVSARALHVVGVAGVTVFLPGVEWLGHNLCIVVQHGEGVVGLIAVNRTLELVSLERNLVVG